MTYGHNVTVCRDRPASRKDAGTYRARHVSGPSAICPAEEGHAGAVRALARRMGYQSPRVQFSPSGKTARFALWDLDPPRSRILERA
jgi:hypothetical protein